MNDLSDLLVEAAILPRIGAASRRNAIQIVTEALAGPLGVDARAAFEAVLLRERLSGTGMGEGVAIPHARVAGLKRPAAAFARLDPAIDFDALDGRPCDLVFLLLAPAERGGDHLKALARLSRFIKRPQVREKLRGARGLEELRAIFQSPSSHSDAA